MSERGILTRWLLDNKDNCDDKEAYVVAACKASPSSTRKTVLTRIAELVHRGDLPAHLVGKRGCTRLSESSRRACGMKHKREMKVPKKFRNAVSANLVEGEWDDESKIDEGLINLGDQVIKDNDFRTELFIAHDRWKLVSTSKKYAENKIELKGKLYRGTFWGQVETIINLRKKVDMV